MYEWDYAIGNEWDYAIGNESVRNELPYATPTVGDCCYSLYHAVETISGPRKSPTAKGKAEQSIYGVITN